MGIDNESRGSLGTSEQRGGMFERLVLRAARTGWRSLAIRAAAYAATAALVAALCAALAGDRGFLAPLGAFAVWLFPGYLLAAAAHPAKAWPFHLAAGFLYALGALAVVGVPTMALHMPFEAAYRATGIVWLIELALGAAWFCRQGDRRWREERVPLAPSGADPRWFCAIAALAMLPALRGELWHDGRVVAVMMAIACLIPFLLGKASSTDGTRFWGPSTRTLEGLFLLACCGFVVLQRQHFWFYCTPFRDSYHSAVLAQGMIGSPAVNGCDVLGGSGAPMPARWLLNLVGFPVATMARTCDLPAAAVMHTDLPVLMSVLLPCAAFAICDALLGGRAWGFAGGALALLPYALLSGNDGKLAGIDLLYYAMHRSAEDNGIVVLVALPTAIASAIELSRSWAWPRFALYAMGGLAMLALHPFAAPYLLFHVGLWAAFGAQPRISLRTALLCAWPLALCGAVFLLSGRYSASLAQMSGTPPERLAAGSGMGIHVGAPAMAAPFFLLVVPPIAWTLYRIRSLRPEERYLAAATLLPIVFALVPPFPWMITRVIPASVLPRVLWLLPAAPATLYVLALAARSLCPAAAPGGAFAALAAALIVLVAPECKATWKVEPIVNPHVTHRYPDTDLIHTAQWVGVRLARRGDRPVLARTEFNDTLALVRPGTSLFFVRAYFFYLEPYALQGRKEEGLARIDFQARAFSGKETEEPLAADLARFRVGMIVLQPKADVALRAMLLGRLGWATVRPAPGEEGWEVLEPLPLGRKTAQGR